MAVLIRTRSPRVFLASMVPFLILLIIGLGVIGSSAPFWQMLLVAVIAGLIGLAAGQLVARTSRRP